MATHVIPADIIFAKYELLVSKQAPLLGCIGDTTKQFPIILQAVLALIKKKDLRHCDLMHQYVDMGMPTDIAIDTLLKAVELVDTFLQKFITEKLHFTSHYCQLDGNNIIVVEYD